MVKPPHTWPRSKSLNIKLDDQRQVVTIEGINYAYDLFRDFGINGMAEGQLFKLTKREKETVTIQRIG